MKKDEMTSAQYQASIQQVAKAGKASIKRPDPTDSASYRKTQVDQVEHDLQKNGVKWFRMAYKQFLIAAIPNAAKRSHQLAKMMKAEGLTKGFPDLIVAWPAGSYHGLFIETKTVNGRVSPEQAIIHAYLTSGGYKVIIPTTFEGFQQGVNEYFKQGEFTL